MELDWLEDLEKKIGQATEELQRLRQDNRRLEERVEELEAQLDSAEPGEGAWKDERQEIRRRVSKLAEDLEHLLDSDAEADLED